MGKIQRFCVLNESHEGDNVFLCHRGYPMGNPYTHIKSKETKAMVIVKTREEAISRYARYFEQSLKLNPEFKKEFERMIEVCMNNDEVWLGCYCKLDEDCHVDYIIRRLRQECTKRLLKNVLKKQNSNEDPEQKTDCPS